MGTIAVPHPVTTSATVSSSSAAPVDLDACTILSQMRNVSETVNIEAPGGAVGVRLQSWSDPLRYRAVDEGTVLHNLFVLRTLCRTCQVLEPPDFELRYLASVMSYISNTASEEQWGNWCPPVFNGVRVLESQYGAYWIFSLTHPLSAPDADTTEGRCTVYFGHATDTSGVQGILSTKYLAPATLADGPGAVGFYAQAALWNDHQSLLQTLDRALRSGKWCQPVIFTGSCSVPNQHITMRSGGGAEAQQGCTLAGAVHCVRDKKWVLHSHRSRVEQLVVAVTKSYLPRTTSAGMPSFVMPPSRTQEVRRALAP